MKVLDSSVFHMNDHAHCGNIHVVPLYSTVLKASRSTQQKQFVQGIQYIKLCKLDCSIHWWEELAEKATIRESFLAREKQVCSLLFSHQFSLACNLHNRFQCLVTFLFSTRSHVICYVHSLLFSCNCLPNVYFCHTFLDRFEHIF
jgi:hypothetical protein